MENDVKFHAMTLLEKSKEYVIKCHKNTNHLYDGQPYTIHLELVYDTAQKFIHLIPEAARQIVLSASWGHDICEDCRETYSDIKQNTNLEVAEIIYALTNEKGKTRKDRANAKYYEGIRNTPYATFVKICDRIANVEYSKKSGSSMFKKYEKENADFKRQLTSPLYKEMWDYLENLFVEKQVRSVLIEYFPDELVEGLQYTIDYDGIIRMLTNSDIELIRDVEDTNLFNFVKSYTITDDQIFSGDEIAVLVPSITPYGTLQVADHFDENGDVECKNGLPYKKECCFKIV